MTVTITTSGDVTIDQTDGLQTGDVAYSTLPSEFQAFLSGLSSALTLDQTNNATSYGAAYAASYVTVTNTGSQPIDDLFFSTASGTLYNGQIATYTDGTGTHNITIAGSTDPIYLYSFNGGDILIGSTQDPGTVDINDVSTLQGSSIVFAYYLDETDDHTGADVWGVTFQPLEHFVDGTTASDYNDSVDFADFLNVTATGEVSFDFDNLRSGKFLWVALGTEGAGLLMTGRDLNVVESGSKAGLRVSGTSDPSDAVNTSQGGVGATTGINNQMYTPGSVGVITFVSGFQPLSSGTGEASGDNVKDIAYDGFLDVKTAGVFISQTQGGGTASLTLSLWQADANNDPNDGNQAETGFNYIGAEGGNNNNSGAFLDDDAVTVATVEVWIGNRETGTLVGTWTIANDNTTIDGVTVDLNGNQASISGLTSGMEVYVSSASGDTFNRLQVEANSGTTPFDIGRVDLDQAVTDVQNVGDNVLIYDDGPSISVDDSSGDFDTGVQNGVWDHDPGTDTFDSMNVTLDSYTINGGSAQTSGIVFNQTSDFVYTGSITADFTPDDGVVNPQKVDFTLTFDPTNPESYTLDVTTPPDTITKFDTSQGSLPAGGPDEVQTLTFPGGDNDVVFFAVNPTAPTDGGSGPTPNDVQDLVTGNPTESYLEGLNAPSLISPTAQMNVSTSGIGVNNNVLNGANEGSGTGAYAGTTITSHDESFVVNPEQDVDTVRVYIDNSVGGYTPNTEDLYYVIYYTDGTVSDPMKVTADMLESVPKQDPGGLWPDATQGGKYFDITDSVDGKEIDAVQLTMGTGTVKIPVIEFITETDFNPAPLTLDLTATLYDADGDSTSDSFSIDLVDSTV